MYRKNHQGGSVAAEALLALVAIIFFLGIIAALIWGAVAVSHVGAVNGGQHTGYVTSVEQEGVFWKTWTVYIKTDVSSSQEDSYCVKDLELLNQLKEKAKTRELITVKYSAPFIVYNWECGHESSIISSLEVDTQVKK